MMQRSANVLGCVVTFILAVNAPDPAIAEDLSLRESVAAAHTVVRGIWISGPSGDRIRVKETIEGTLHSEELPCSTGAKRAPAAESILLLQRPTASTCTLIGSTGVGRQSHVVFIIGQTRFSRGDYAGAAKAWRAVLNDGPLDAYNNLGYLVRNGLGVRRNDAEAVRLWRYAAERGIPESQIHLASAFAEGGGVRRDLAEALAWSNCAQEFYGRAADDEVARSGRERAQRLTRAIRKLASPVHQKEGELRAAIKAERINAYWSERLQ